MKFDIALNWSDLSATRHPLHVSRYAPPAEKTCQYNRLKMNELNAEKV